MPFSTLSTESYFASTSTHTEVLPATSPPTSDVTHMTWAALEMRAMPDPTDDEFGYTFDAHRQSMGDVPPPYAEEATILLPEYSVHAPESLTLAKYLFKFGFIFFPIWILGAFILLSPLREPPALEDSTPAWMPEKTEDERKAIIAMLRAVEIKWATRCLCALLIFAVLPASGAFAAWTILRR